MEGRLVFLLAFYCFNVLFCVAKPPPYATTLMSGDVFSSDQVGDYNNRVAPDLEGRGKWQTPTQEINYIELIGEMIAAGNLTLTVNQKSKLRKIDNAVERLTRSLGLEIYIKILQENILLLNLNNKDLNMTSDVLKLFMSQETPHLELGGGGKWQLTTQEIDYSQMFEHSNRLFQEMATAFMIVAENLTLTVNQKSKLSKIKNVAERLSDSLRKEANIKMLQEKVRLLDLNNKDLNMASDVLNLFMSQESPLIEEAYNFYISETTTFSHDYKENYTSGSGDYGDPTLAYDYNENSSSASIIYGEPDYDYNGSIGYNGVPSNNYNRYNDFPVNGFTTYNGITINGSEAERDANKKMSDETGTN